MRNAIAASPCSRCCAACGRSSPEQQLEKAREQLAKGAYAEAVAAATDGSRGGRRGRHRLAPRAGGPRGRGARPRRPRRRSARLERLAGAWAKQVSGQPLRPDGGTAQGGRRRRRRDQRARRRREALPGGRRHRQAISQAKAIGQRRGARAASLPRLHRVAEARVQEGSMVESAASEAPLRPRILSLLATLALAAAPHGARAQGAASAAPTPSGIRVVVESPSHGATLQSRENVVEVRGTAVAAGEEAQRFDVMIVMDVSKSTQYPSGADVDGDGVVGENPQEGLYAPGEYPSDVVCTDPEDTILAAEVAAARALIAQPAARAHPRRPRHLLRRRRPRDEPAAQPRPAQRRAPGAAHRRLRPHRGRARLGAGARPERRHRLLRGDPPRHDGARRAARRGERARAARARR